MPTVGFVSLGCPKALVDSERILTGLARAGIETVDGDADVTVVNTCGFIDAAREESFATIEALLDAGGEVVITGCLGKEMDLLRTRFPRIRHISGPAEPDRVVAAVSALAPTDGEVEYLMGPAGIKLTPPHYAYLKISEGCNHHCTFCIIPGLRGRLRSRRIDEVLAEADALAAQGVKEALVIAQDTSAYGLDLRYAPARVGDRELATDIRTLSEALGERFPWVRLHYVYPYPHVDELVPLMAEGRLLPYLDMPLQHASPAILKAMRRPAAVERMLERLARWRELCPDLAIRSTFIVGFPGETDDDFGMLLDFLEDARLDRVGCFTYSAVAGAAANALADHVPERDKLDRQETLMEVQAAISADKLQQLVGRRMRVLVDAVEGEVTIARTVRDAPDVDGVVVIQDARGLVPGDFAWVEVTGADDHDLEARQIGRPVQVG
ncbi:MAG: 30S ribosomal protein S12 methylthiotransferase RimO [Pseudomonadales bacterium]|nr:30S ribosomal protein S12 methylthiotransferase RimO [Pseudomonadales bacterium]MCP5185175.1 30S ribosomal protein S12 methylthiotransferase RimO [Pseudomonadales bacterium]